MGLWHAYGGGGGKGAYQVFFLRELYRLGVITPEDEPEGIAGVSVGAWNGGSIAQYPRGEHREGVSRTCELWAKSFMTNRDAYRYYFPPYVSGKWKTSFANVKPLEAILDEYFDPEKVKASGMKVRFPAVDMHSNDRGVVVFDETSEDLRLGILASSSFPGWMPPREYGDMLLTDAGVADVMPIKQAITAGADRILAIHLGPPDVGKKNIENTFDVLAFAISKMQQEILVNDLVGCAETNDLLLHLGPQIQEALQRLPADAALRRKYEGKRYVDMYIVGPSVKLGSGLSFKREDIRFRAEVAIRDARKHAKHIDSWLHHGVRQPESMRNLPRG